MHELNGRERFDDGQSSLVCPHPLQYRSSNRVRPVLQKPVASSHRYGRKCPREERGEGTHAIAGGEIVGVSRGDRATAGLERLRLKTMPPLKLEAHSVKAIREARILLRRRPPHVSRNLSLPVSPGTS